MFFLLLHLLSSDTYVNNARRDSNPLVQFSTIAIFLLLCSCPGVVSGQIPYDNFESAYEINLTSSGNYGSFSDSTIKLTREPGEPDHAGVPGNKSWWFRFTTQISGPVTISTDGSSFDTVLAVYSGTSIDELTPIVSDDDSGEGLASRVRFHTRVGRTYYVALDGYGGASGNFRFRYYGSGWDEPVNDDFANAATLPGTSGSIISSNSKASHEPEEPDHAGLFSRYSVWWKYTAEATGTVTLNTNGSTYDSILAVYTGSSLRTLTEVVSDNDSGEFLASLVTFDATAGTTYYIAIDSLVGMSYYLNYSGPALPDDLSLSHRSLSESCDTGTTATSRSFEVAYSGDSTSVPYTITSNVSWIRTDATSGTLTGSPQVHTILFNRSVSAGIYHGTITVSSPYTKPRKIVVKLIVTTRGPVNDDFADGTVLSGSSGTVTATNVNASREVGEPKHAGGTGNRSLWWRYVAQDSGIVNLDTLGSRVNVVLGVYTGSSVGELTTIASDVSSGSGYYSKVAFTAVAGTVYHIAVDKTSSSNYGDNRNVVLNYSGPSGTKPALSGFPNSLSVQAPLSVDPPSQRLDVWNSGTTTPLTYSITDDVPWLHVHPASGTSDGTAQEHTISYSTAGMSSGTYNGTITIDSPNAETRSIPVTLMVSNLENDNFSSATVLSGLSGTAGGSNFLATMEPGEPDSINRSGGKSAWWRYTAEGNGTVTINTSGSSFDTIVGVYTGSSIGDLSSVITGDDGDDEGATVVSFTATRGTTYYIAVYGYGDDNGSIVLYYNGPPPPPPGLSRYPTSLSPTGAFDSHPSTQSFEVWNPGSGSISYTITSDVPWLSVDPANGTSTGSRQLHTVTYDVTGLASGTHQGTISIRSPGVFTYTVVVTLTLWTTLHPTNDNFANAAVFPWTSSVVNGSNERATKEPDELNHMGRSGGNSIWYRFTSEYDGTVTINTNGSNFDTVLAVYSGLYIDELTAVISDDDSGNDRASSVTFTATAGTPYHIAVDGFYGATGKVKFAYAGPSTYPSAISFFPTSLSVSSAVGKNPPAQTFTVWYTSRIGPLNYSFGTDAYWMRIGPTIGSSETSPQTYTITYNTSHLMAGTYDATITIHNANSPVCFLPITLTVEEPTAADSSWTLYE